MRFKYGFTFGIIILIFLLAGCGMVQPSREANGSNIQDPGSVSAEKPSANSKNSVPNNPASIPEADKNFRYIHMVDTMTGWASTGKSILRTVDSGEKWTDITPKGITDLIPGPMFCQDGQTAWCAYITGDSPPKMIIYRTKDGGQNWEKAEISGTYSSPSIVSLSFPDSTHGWFLLSYCGKTNAMGVDVFKTDDGGASWKRVTSGNPNQVNRITNGIPFEGDKTGLVFANHKDGWLTGYSAGSTAWLYTTHDGGLNWVYQKLPIPKGYHIERGSGATFSPRFFGSKDGVLPVFFVKALILYATHDGGISWNVTTPVELPEGALWSIIDAQHSIVSDYYSLYYTSDGMGSFVSIKPNIDLKNLLKLDFVTAQLGWAIIDGDLWKTVDGGYIWTKVSCAP